jgi:hypothetical protein
VESAVWREGEKKKEEEEEEEENVQTSGPGGNSSRLAKFGRLVNGS